MGLLDGILGLASPALTATTNAVTGYKQGQAARQHDVTKEAIEKLKADREAKSAAIMDALRQAQAGAMGQGKPVLRETEDGFQWFTPPAPNREAAPSPPPSVTPNFTPQAPTLQGGVQAPPQPPTPQQSGPPQARVVPTGVKGKAPPTKTDPYYLAAQKRIQELVASGVKVEDARNRVRAEFGQQEGQAPAQSGIVLPGANGAPSQGVVTSTRDPNKLFSTTPIPTVQKTGPGAGGTSGMGQNMQARLLAAVSEGRLADQRMSEFEKGRLKGGRLRVNTLEGVGGRLATDLRGHDIKSAIVGGGMEGIMSAGDSDYLQYMRDARLIARAEQLMSARGGSEAMASDNAFLARGGANASEAIVRAAQKSRRALFGNLGAVIQTLTPEQIEKLNRGLEALKNDEDIDYGAVGKDVFGAGGIGTVPGPRVAPPVGAKPPSFEDWLKRKP